MDWGQPRLYWLRHISWDGISILKSEGVHWWMKSMSGLIFKLQQQYVLVCSWMQASHWIEWTGSRRLSQHQQYTRTLTSLCVCQFAISLQCFTSFFLSSNGVFLFCKTVPFLKEESTQKHQITVIKVLLCDHSSSTQITCDTLICWDKFYI